MEYDSLSSGILTKDQIIRIFLFYNAFFHQALLQCVQASKTHSGDDAGRFSAESQA